MVLKQKVQRRKFGNISHEYNILSRPNAAKLGVLFLIVAAVATFGWWGAGLGLPTELPDAASLRQWFIDLGAWGPAAVIALMIVAILISPLPSAPIALAAGAIYGHFWGALYVLIGSEIGAIAAFGIARFFGYGFLHAWLGDQLQKGLAGSQNVLMASVFASRLMPFISFDIVSYAAGLTCLSLWRFVIATLAGIIPASFLLAHFGSELSAGDGSRIGLAVLVLGLITAVPIAIKLFMNSRKT